MTERLMTFNSQ